MPLKTVAIIGTGNVAWHLAPALDNAGYSVREVYGRDKKNSKALTGRLYQATDHSSLDFSQSRTSIFIIATADSAIEEIAQEIILPEEAVLVHTSGSQPMRILEFTAASKIGVFYPLQRFRKSSRIRFEDVPIFIETEDDEVNAVLQTMAKTISKHVQPITSVQRMALHIAATIASTFTNHMLTISKDIVQQNHLDYNLLKPLISETLSHSLENDPTRAQTGPAIQEDFQVLDQHVEFLQEQPAVAEIYRIVSQHIIDRFHNENE
ncbi:MAG: DUF2520 domain-containing protein [Flammeovirgaceae bacterium]|nr:DUF2520 domain-containing protein [Flammeovirgaceae bacterium]